MLKQGSFDKLTGLTLGTYRLEQFVGQGKTGPTFLARTDATTTYVIHFLIGSMSPTVKEQELELERFQYQASLIATLQHPHILPLLDFGVYRGLPYLVSPHIPLRPLRNRIAKNGVLDTLTVGRYLDQIATALEYAHAHSILHGSLSVDSVFLRLDGQLVVADIGVRSLLEQDAPGTQFPMWDDGYAPEQLLGKPSSPASDVYALGGILFYLLTGSAVFEGSTPDELAQQHLYAPIAPLSQWRSDLPAGLYSILARALAKDPAQRFPQPGALANAYHRTVAPTNRTRVPFVVPARPKVQVQQSADGGTTVADMPISERAWSNNTASAMADHLPGSSASRLSSSLPHSLHGFSDDEPLNVAAPPRSARMPHPRRKYKQRVIPLAILLVVLLVVTSTLGIVTLAQRGAATANASGQATFFADPNHPGGETNALRLTIQNLAAPPSGSEYEAWIINDQSEQVTGLGKLTEKNQIWSLAFSEANTNLLAEGDKLEVTLEQGEVTAPTGKAILVGTFPAQAFQHIQHLLVSFPTTPGKIGMLIGVVQQTHALDIQAAVLQSVAASRDSVAIGCAAQSMLDIIEGTHGTHYHPLVATCLQRNITVTGDGFGLLGKNGYVASAEEHASLALNQPDATSVMRQHAALMDIALSNITGWVTTTEQDLLRLQAHPADLSSLQEIATLTDAAYRGVDANGNGQIDLIAGEAGALTAYQQGQLMATLSLVHSA